MARNGGRSCGNLGKTRHFRKWTSKNERRYVKHGLVSAVKGADDLVKYENDTVSFYVNGSATAKLKVPIDGDYLIIIEASCSAALKENAKLTLKVGDKAITEKFELTTEDKKEYKFDAKLTKGETTLSIAFTNDIYKENEYDRNLFVHGVRVEKK